MSDMKTRPQARPRAATWGVAAAAAGLLVGLVLGGGAGCSGTEAKLEGTTMDKDISADLDTALATKIFFAHQSVGNNLLSGVERLAAGAGRELKLAKLEEAD